MRMQEQKTYAISLFPSTLNSRFTAWGCSSLSTSITCFAIDACSGDANGTSTLLYGRKNLVRKWGLLYSAPESLLIQLTRCANPMLMPWRRQILYRAWWQVKTISHEWSWKRHSRIWPAYHISYVLGENTTRCIRNQQSSGLLIDTSQSIGDRCQPVHDGHNYNRDIVIQIEGKE